MSFRGLLLFIALACAGGRPADPLCLGEITNVTAARLRRVVQTFAVEAELLEAKDIPRRRGVITFPA